MSVILISEALFLFLTTLFSGYFISSRIASSSAIERHQSIHELERFNKSCPQWKYDKYHNSSCECGVALQGVVECSNDRPSVFVLTCHCMSYSDEDDDMLVVGTCMYLCNQVYYSTVSELTDLNNLCNFFVQQNRRGQMCGQCVDNHSPSPYSYLLKCAHCSDYRYNWIKYILIAFFPLTILYLFVVIFKFNAALSPSMNGFIFYCQIMTSPALMSITSNYTCSLAAEGDNLLYNAQQFVSALYGIWNLDFFRMVYEPFCLHPNMSLLQILSLDYLVAVYPLFLVCLTYLLVQLHDRLQVVKYLWKPMAWLYGRFNHQWKVSNSLIEAFGTFFLLSYVKITNTSFNLLMPTTLYNASGHTVGMYLYYNGSVEYFGNTHLPYAVLALFMFITFNIMPLLLLSLYPCRFFQSLLNICHLNSQILRTFMDAFHGCYKFEPYDCRYWAAFYLFLRILILAFFGLTQSCFFVLLTGITLVPVIILTVVVWPYKWTIYNILDVIFFLALVQVFFAFTTLLRPDYMDVDRKYAIFSSTAVATGLLFPFVYAVSLALKTILPSKWIAGVQKYVLYLCQAQL